MVGASVLGVFLQGLPPDRRVAMARVASLIRRAARGVRESKRFGLVFYELNGGPLFALESRDKLLTLYVAERKAAEPFFTSIAGFDTKRCLINFADLNRLPLPDIEKLVRASVVARRERGSAPDQKDLLSLWGVKEEEAAVAPPVVRISMRTAEEEAAEQAAREEAERHAAAMKKILKPTKPEKTLVKKIAAAKAAARAQAKVEAAERRAAQKAAALESRKTAQHARKAAALPKKEETARRQAQKKVKAETKVGKPRTVKSEDKVTATERPVAKKPAEKKVVAKKPAAKKATVKAKVVAKPKVAAKKTPAKKVAPSKTKKTATAKPKKAK